MRELTADLLVGRLVDWGVDTVFGLPADRADGVVEAFDAAALLDVATLLDDAHAHLGMSAAARALGRPGAADAVARLVLAVAERKPLPDAETIERLSRGRAA